jgi:hypothetical protein
VREAVAYPTLREKREGWERIPQEEHMFLPRAPVDFPAGKSKSRGVEPDPLCLGEMICQPKMV